MSERSNLESYPPVIRHLINATPNISKPKRNNSMEEDTTTQAAGSVPIPVVDLHSLNNLEDACKEWGLFHLFNHGIPQTLLSQLQDHARILFALSFESKQALITCPMSYFWGTPALTSSGVALKGGAGGALNINLLEGLNVRLSKLPQFQNQDPMLDCFRVLLEEYGKHLGRIATTLFEAMLKNLDLGSKHSESKLADESTGFIRVYRYPPSSMVDRTWGMIEHTDSSVLSILNQDQVGGLEIFKDNEWLLVNPMPNTLLVHIGDMMQAISDDEYASVKHRVRVNKEEERFSICYFVFPSGDSVIRSSKYRPFTYTNFQEQVQNDIVSLGYKVGLSSYDFFGKFPAGWGISNNENHVNIVPNQSTQIDHEQCDSIVDPECLVEDADFKKRKCCNESAFKCYKRRRTSLSRKHRRPNDSSIRCVNNFPGCS